MRMPTLYTVVLDCHTKDCVTPTLEGGARGHLCSLANGEGKGVVVFSYKQRDHVNRITYMKIQQQIEKGNQFLSVKPLFSPVRVEQVPLKTENNPLHQHCFMHRLVLCCFKKEPLNDQMALHDTLTSHPSLISLVSRQFVTLRGNYFILTVSFRRCFTTTLNIDSEYTRVKVMMKGGTFWESTFIWILLN